MIHIDYTTEDRWGHDDPDMYALQPIRGEVSLVTEDEDGDVHTKIGVLELVKVNLDHVPSGYLPELLDYQEADWNEFLFVNDWIYGDEYPEEFEDGVAFAHSLLILNRLTLTPDVRGQGIGLNVLARACLTWGEAAIILAIASPIEVGKHSKKIGQKKLAAYWSRLGLTVRPDVPVLYGSLNYRDTFETMKSLALGVRA